MGSERTVRRRRSDEPRVGAVTPEVEVRLLGQFEVSVEGRRIDQWRRRTAELVQLLALTPGHRLDRRSVVEALWPHLSEERGVANLHKAAHQVRRTTGCTDALVLDDGYVWLWPGASVQVDLVEFEREAERALASLDRGQCGALADRSATPLAPMCRSTPWGERAIRRLKRLRRELLHAAGRFRDALLLDPCDEAAHRALMRAALDQDDPASALAQYRDLCERLSDLEFDLRPAPETVALYNEAVTALQMRERPSRAPLAGCDQQLRAARHVLRRAATGEGGSVLVRGPSEQSTLRLALQITDEATHAGFTVLRAATVPTSTLTDGPIAMAVRDLLTSRPELALSLPPSTCRTLDQLTGRHPDDGARPLAPSAVAVAVRDLLHHSAGVGASVLLVDGVQDVDQDTAAVLGRLTDAVRFASVMVVLVLTPAEDLPAHVEGLVGRLVGDTDVTDLPVAA